jgi:aldehyde:ferredoxin oxidoreductase
MVGGYAGKILEIDLTRKKMETKPLDMGFARKYLGGLGFGYRMLWDRVKPVTNPLSPENPLMFLLGPFNGILPGKLVVAFKSPITGGVGASLVSGHFQAEIKFAGYDGIIFNGKSEKPVYLYIRDESVEFRDANYLWGKTTHETEELLRKDLGDRLIRVASIGPAGENHVYFAAIMCDSGRAAARLGAGMIMGLKNIKAVAIRGTQGVRVENLEEFNGLFREAIRKVDYNWRRFGSLQHTARASYWMSAYPHKNWQEEYDPHVIRTCDGPALELKHLIRRKSCFNCITQCASVAIVRSGRYACVTEGPEYEHVAFWSGDIDVHNSDMLIYSVHRCDELGLDAISTGSVIAFAMELYQRGIITEKYTEGLDLAWGNEEAILALMENIAYRRGRLGDLLAYGSKIAADKIGKGADYYAIQCKGNEMGAYGLRSGLSWVRPLAFATGLRGGNHNEASSPYEQDNLMIENSLSICLFSRIAVGYDLLSLLNAITGWKISREEYDKIGERITNIGKAFMVREGFRREHDTIPERFFKEPLTTGVAKGSVVNRKLFEKELDEYYKERGWDEKTSIPTSEKLRQLDLEDIDSELQKYREPLRKDGVKF